MASADSSVRTLIDEHYATLYRYAYRLTGKTADAEDLTQEAYGKALSRWQQLRDHSKAKNWLFRILRNAYLRRLRDDRRQKVVSIDSIGDIQEEDREIPSVIEPGQLQDALNELEESFRTPLILFYFEEFSYRDIAEQMDLPIGTVMSRLARAKAHLKTRLLRPMDNQVTDSPRRGSDGV